MKVFKVLGLFFLSILGLSAQISGTVFRDFNGNGIKESAEPLVAGVLVKAYDVSGSQCGTTQTTTSATAPNYTISGCSGQVRIEFEIPASACQLSNGIDYSGLSGSAYGSSVQFVNANTSNVNFAVHFPGEYGGPDSFDPKIYNVIMQAGDPIPSPTPPSGDITYTANKKSVVSTGYNINSPPITNYGQGSQANEASRQLDQTILALAGQTGTLWGNAYSKQANRLFVSAFTRRHAGMGPLGPGGIYIINPSSPNLSGSLAFANFDALGFATHASSGSYNVKSNTVRGLVAQPFYTPSTDADSYEQVGKTSFGDLEISEDGRYLFVVNLFDRKLYRIDLQNAASPVAPTSANISSYTIANPCNTTNAGEYRPFALKVFRGKLYIGVVCSGQDASNNEIGNSSTMTINLYQYDLSAANIPSNPQLIYSQNLSYRDNDVIQDYNNPPNPNGGAIWNPWRNEFRTTENSPIFSDIDFDNNGDIILGLADRNTYQTGGGQNDLNGNAPVTKTYANGDIIKVAKDISCNLSIVTGSYFQNDLYEDQAEWGNIIYSQPYTHAEITLGGLAAHRKSTANEIVSTAFNPVSYTSNGIITFDNNNGQQLRTNEIWADYCDPNIEACMWKAGAIGDIEVLGILPPIEIGNRVWNDVDMDGIQDPGEAAISGVSVQLIKAGTVEASAITDNNGNYYFSSAAGTSTPSFRYGVTALMPNMAYTVRIPNYTSQAALVSLSPTTANTGGSGQPDVRDSDGSVIGSNVEATILTSDIPIAGANNHTFDFGFSPALNPSGDCYAVADNGNDPQLYRIDCMTGASTYVGPLAINQDVEAIELSPSYVNLFGIAAQAGLPAAFGSINKITGAWTQIGLIGAADGAQGTISPVEMDGMTHDEFGNMWTISNSPITAVLFKIDTTTGSVVQNTFGANIDYLKITGAAVNMEVEDMAYDVTTGKYYIVGNGTGPTPDSKLYELNVSTGFTTLVADFVHCNEDIEGLTVTPTGELKGTSGNGGNGGADNPACMDRFYHLTFSGGVTEVSEIDPTNTHNDFEAMTCPGTPLMPDTCLAMLNAPITQCNNNNTPANSSDDWFTLTVTGTVTNGSGNYVVKIGAYTSPVTSSGTPISITGNGLSGNPLLQANGTGTYLVRIEDANDSSCFTTIAVGPVQSCSNCPDPNCFNITKQIIR
ncbi:MAG TPA: SdrD B-like domain-containing protein [Saprospiraceae bacterium]|nr:SdrD B-like domain-containing protein [Saprospiraceae bacterium]